MEQKPEVWQRGPIPEITPLLQPVAHALLQAREEVEDYMHDFPESLLWLKPLGLAAVGFHLQHLSGVIDRIFTYARAEGLQSEQIRQLKEENADGGLNYTLSELLSRFSKQVDAALEQLRRTDPESLTEFRGIGRAAIPSTVIGLLVHAAEHTMRHVGQLLVTSAVLKNKEK